MNRRVRLVYTKKHANRRDSEDRIEPSECVDLGFPTEAAADLFGVAPGGQ